VKAKRSGQRKERGKERGKQRRTAKETGKKGNEIGEDSALTLYHMRLKDSINELLVFVAASVNADHSSTGQRVEDSTQLRMALCVRSSRSLRPIDVKITARSRRQSPLRQLPEAYPRMR